MDLNRGRHTSGLNDLVERSRGPGAPLIGKPANQGKGTGPLQHPRVQSGQGQQWELWCRGRPTVASATTRVVWAGNVVQHGNDQNGKFP
jgi:hypothetical protein